MDWNGYLPLHVAAENGHENLLPLLLGSEKEYIDLQGELPHNGLQQGTALHLASANGHERVVASLLHCKAAVDAQDYRGWTALHKASARWQYGTANLLLRHGADVNSRTRQGLTAVELAAKSGFPALVGLILQHQSAGDCDGNCGPALILAVKNGDLETASLLLRHTEAMQGVIKSHQLEAALEAALKNKDIHVVELLLKYGADATATTHLSLDGENTDILGMLLDHGANIEAKDAAGKTVLHHAIGQPQGDLAQFLIDHGADIKAKDDTGNTVLHIAVENGRQELTHLLVDRGADIEAKDDAGQTVFHYTIDAGDRQIVRTLKERGADFGTDIVYRRKLYSLERYAAEEEPTHGETSTEVSRDTTRP